jgi:hypothetical protein
MPLLPVVPGEEPGMKLAPLTLLSIRLRPVEEYRTPVTVPAVVNVMPAQIT